MLSLRCLAHILILAGLCLGLNVGKGDAATSTSFGTFESGSALQNYCKSKLGSFGSAVCAGFIVGVYDALMRQQAERQIKNIVCPPALTRTNLLEVVNRGLKEAETSGQLENPAYDIVLEAFRKSYPCL